MDTDSLKRQVIISVMSPRIWVSSVPAKESGVASRLSVSPKGKPSSSESSRSQGVNPPPIISVARKRQ